MAATDIDENARLADTTLVLAAHGSTRRPAANAHVNGIASEVRSRSRFGVVETVFYLGGNNANIIGSRLVTPRAVIVPVMMSNGELSSRLVRDIEAAAQDLPDPPEIRSQSAIGCNPMMAELIEHVAIEALIPGAGVAAEDATLVLVAHGSKKASFSRQAAEPHVSAIAKRGTFASVELCFIEEPPFAAETLSKARGPIVVVGLFAAPGGHAIDDVTAAINDADRNDLIDAGPVGRTPRLVDLIISAAELEIDKL